MPSSASQQPQWQRRCHDLWKRHCPAVKHLFAPIARESILIKEHGRTSLAALAGRPSGAALESPLGSVKVLTAGAVQSSRFEERDIAATTHRPRGDRACLPAIGNAVLPLSSFGHYTVLE